MNENFYGCGRWARTSNGPIETPTAPTGKIADHARLPAVLRYRGLHSEALMAARLMRVESLVGTLRSVLDDLQLLTQEPVAYPETTVDWTFAGVFADDGELGAPEFDRRHAQLVEAILKDALLKLWNGSGAHRSSSTAGPHR